MTMLLILTILLLCCGVLELLILLLFLRPLLVLRQPHRQQNRQTSLKMVDPATLVAVLQQIQRLFKYEALQSTPRVSDILALIQTIEAEFGDQADLERIIQQLCYRASRALKKEQKQAVRDEQEEEKRRQRIEQRLQRGRQQVAASMDEVPA